MELRLGHYYKNNATGELYCVVRFDFTTGIDCVIYKWIRCGDIYTTTVKDFQKTFTYYNP